jgi:protein TonB
MPEPDYPPLSRERGEQGVVMLQLAVDASGRLGEVNVLRSSGFARLDKAARAAVQRWRFQPAIENGQPVAAQLTLPVRFALDEN